MLDIYYVSPSIKVKPEAPDRLELAGSIDLDAHRSLAALFEKGRQAGADLMYFGDSMLKPTQVEVLLKTFTANARELERNEQARAAFNLISDLLEDAVSRGVGLVAFGD